MLMMCVSTSIGVAALLWLCAIVVATSRISEHESFSKSMFVLFVSSLTIESGSTFTKSAFFILTNSGSSVVFLMSSFEGVEFRHHTLHVLRCMRVADTLKDER